METLEPTPQAEQSLEATLAALASTPIPPGVDSQVFSDLTAELKRILLARESSQLTPHPPEGDSNRVKDLRLVEQSEAVWQLQWSYVNVGDYDQNGEVNISDLTPLGMHFSEKGPFAFDSVESVVDGDGNGEINLADVTPIGMNFRARITAYNIYGSATATDHPATWDAPNGPGALLLGCVTTDVALPAIDQRATFTLDVDPPDVGINYWLLPTDGMSEGSSSLNAGLNDWSLPGHDRQHTRRSLYLGAKTNKLKWAFRTTGPGFSFNDAAVGPDGTIYVASGPELYALKPAGGEKWISFQCWPSGRPCLAANGTIYVGSHSNGLYAFNPDGSQKWLYAQDGVAGSPAIAPDGTVYIWADSDQLCAVNPDGTEKWTYTTDGNLQSATAIGSDGTVYFGSDDNKLYAIDPDGAQKWSYLTGGEVRTPPAIASDGTVYIGSQDAKLYAINPDSTEKWSFVMGDKASTSPAIGSDGTVYIGSLDQQLYAVNPDGIEKWSFAMGDAPCTSPAIDSDGTVYVSSYEGKFFALGNDGSLKWSYATGNKIQSPVIGIDGTLYAVSYDKLYAINPDGTEKWYYGIADDEFNSPPAIADDGTVYVVSFMQGVHAISSSGTLEWSFDNYAGAETAPAIGDDGTVYAGYLGAALFALYPDGTQKWKFTPLGEPDGGSAPAINRFGMLYWPTSGPDAAFYAINSIGNDIWSIEGPMGSPAIADDETIYANTYTWLRANNVDGTMKWSYDTGLEHNSPPAIAENGTVYIGTSSNVLLAINPDGSLRWSFTAEDSAGGTTAPAIGADGTAYVCSGWPYARLYAVDFNGNEMWSFAAGGTLDAPTIGADGTVYVGCSDGRLYAIGP